MSDSITRMVDAVAKFADSVEQLTTRVDKRRGDAFGDKVKVPVFKDGKKIGEVSKSSTSLAAAKLGGGPCEFGSVDGVRGWVVKKQKTK